jgi:hypothetical protein
LKNLKIEMQKKDQGDATGQVPEKRMEGHWEVMKERKGLRE